MPQDIDTLTLKLQQFNYTLQFIKKIQDEDDCNYLRIQRVIQQSQVGQCIYKVIQNYQKISTLIKQIKEKFKKGKFKHEQQFLKQKFQKDFQKKLQLYLKLLQARRSTKTLQLNVLRTKRQTISIKNYNQSQYDKDKNKRQANKSDSDQDQPKQKIQLQQVNQQTLYYQRMIELKEKQLLQVKDKMEAALTVQKDIGRLVNQQGEKLDIAQQNIDSARSNVKEAGELLEEGKKHHQSLNRKKLIIAGIIFLLLVIIIVPIIVKFT